MALKQRVASADVGDVIDISGDGRLTKKIIQVGNGVRPRRDGSHCMAIHYTGRLKDGSVFDSSIARGHPFEFVLGASQVITGWDHGVATMTLGERAILTCAPDFAYGARGAGGGLVPPNATLMFELELLGWKRANLFAIAAVLLTVLTVITCVAASYCAFKYLAFPSFDGA